MKKVYQSSAIKTFVASVLLLSTANVYADNSKVAASDKPVVEQIVNTLTTLSGGPHKGYRANHAKGIVVLGDFQMPLAYQTFQMPMVMLSQKALRFALHWQMALSPTL
jgi:hypothetical protein